MQAQLLMALAVTRCECVCWGAAASAGRLDIKHKAKNTQSDNPRIQKQMHAYEQTNKSITNVTTQKQALPPNTYNTLSSTAKYTNIYNNTN